ncbi:MAG TPA: PucR family transcriptional regulator [Propionibacteriaceae bacterium]
MTVTLARLLRVPALALRLLAGDDERPISWVHSSDLADPTPFLGPGQLLLTTGTQFAPDDPDQSYRDYVARLGEAGIRAIGFGTDVVRSGTPAELVAVCDAYAMALVEVPYRTPFIAVARWVADAMAEEAHARDAWTLQAQRAISVAALSKGRILAVLDELARQLSAEVILYDGHGTLSSRHGLASATGTSGSVQREALRMLHRGMRTASTLDQHGEHVALQTLGRRNELRGVLAVAPRGELDAAATAVITSTVALAEFALEDANRQHLRTFALHAQLLQLILDGHVDATRRALAATGRQLPTEPLRVLVCDGNEPHAADLEHQLDALGSADREAVFVAPHQNVIAVLVAEHDSAGVLARFTEHGIAVGVSRSTDFAGVGAALVQGRSALGRAAGRGITVRVDDEDIILGLLPRREVAGLARSRLARLLAEPDGTELLRTLEVWLGHNALWEPAARELGLHRHTVKAQVRRAGTLVDLPLDTFAGKAELWALLSAR